MLAVLNRGPLAESWLVASAVSSGFWAVMFSLVGEFTIIWGLYVCTHDVDYIAVCRVHGRILIRIKA